MAKLDRALELAEQGFFVFPLLPNRKFNTLDGLSWTEEATRDTTTIETWWSREPDCNIGIHCGRFGDGPDESLFAIDVDVRDGKEGERSLAQLKADCELPATAEQITPSGGRHIIYRLPVSIGQGSANALGPGVDTRTGNNYILGPGSTINGKDYRWDGEYRAPAPIPRGLARRVTAQPKPKKDDTPPVELKTGALPFGVLDYVMHAEPAVAYAGGNDQTYKVACGVRDYGLMEADALALLWHLYRPYCFPPWSYGELRRIVRNAYKYADSPQGNASPESDFKPIVSGEIEWEPKRKRWRPKKIKLPNAHEIELRRWLLGNRLMIGKVSVIIAPPGVGKSTYSSGATLAVVTGEKRILDELVHETGEVLIVANEEDQEEVNRRLAAMIKHHGLDKSLIEDRIHFATASDETPFTLARSTKDGTVSPVHRDDLLEYLNENPAIKLVIVDPFVETHECDENSNREINDVARMYRAIAVKTGTAVLIIHHTRKPPAGSSDAHIGNMDSGRGASALTGVARVIKTLYGMTRKDAESRGMGPEEASRWVRLDDAKGNLHLASGKPKWYYKESVFLGNGPHGLDGDSVGILIPDEPSAPTDGEDGSGW